MKHTMRMGLVAMIAAMAAATSADAAPHCTPTARLVARNYPGAENIPSTNNLLLPTGKAVPVEGQRLIITGHVMDVNCVPIKEAVVELWQTDPYGQLFLATDSDRANARPVFAGAGRTITDMNGEFTFITAFPGVSAAARKNKRAMTAPHVNLRINAEYFTAVTTTLFFENDRRNADDVVYKKLTAAQKEGTTLTMRQGENGDVMGETAIVLDGKTRYRTY